MGFNLRRYTSQTNLRLVIGFIFLLFIVGDGLIWLIYGRGAAVLGVICLLASIFPLLLIGLALWLMDWFLKRENARK